MLYSTYCTTGIAPSPSLSLQPARASSSGPPLRPGTQLAAGLPPPRLARANCLSVCVLQIQGQTGSVSWAAALNAHNHTSPRGTLCDPSDLELEYPRPSEQRQPKPKFRPSWPARGCPPARLPALQFACLLSTTLLFSLILVFLLRQMHNLDKLGRGKRKRKPSAASRQATEVSSVRLQCAILLLALAAVVL